MERIVVVSACDDKYAQYCGILITSIFDNNKDSEVVANILTDYISEDNRKLLKLVADKYCQTINVIDIDKSQFAHLPLPAHAPQINICAYYRLLIPALFSSEDRVLYLDCDMIVRKSLVDLWRTDMVDYAFAGVRDSYLMQRCCSRLKYPLEEYYYNSGMLLFNIKYLKENNYDFIVQKLIKDHYDLIVCHDQDILNACFHGHFKPISTTWNMLDIFLHRDYPYEYEDIADFRSSRVDPAILHYSGPCSKPWFKDTYHPYKYEFLKYYEMSPWRFEMKYRLPLMLRIESYVKYYWHEFLGFIGLKYGDVSPKC